MKRLFEPGPETASKKPAKQPPKKALVPQIVNTPPASHQQRVQYLKVLCDNLTKTKHPTPESTSIELEKDAAIKSSTTTYPMAIRILVKDILRGKFDPKVKDKLKIHEKNKVRDGLQKLKLNLADYPQFLTEIPETKYLDRSAIECTRCGLNIDSPKQCKFHLMKRQFDFKTRKLSEFFPCCGENVNEPNFCESRDQHVFKLSHPGHLAKVSPFTMLPEGPARLCLGVDCEMIFTSNGLELARATFVDFESGETVFDKLIIPTGEVWDYNTRFSGITSLSEEYSPINMSDFHTEVSKFASESTIFIGHGIENDLIAMRLIHKNIIDTAVMFKGPKNRTQSLKEVSWEEIGRKIQSGEHSSYEDAKACIDIIKHHLQHTK